MWMASISCTIQIEWHNSLSLKSDNIDFRFSINGCERRIWNLNFMHQLKCQWKLVGWACAANLRISNTTTNSKYSVNILSNVSNCQTIWHCSTVSGRTHSPISISIIWNSAIWIALDFGNEIYESWNIRIWFVASFFQWKFFDCHFSCENIRLSRFDSKHVGFVKGLWLTQLLNHFILDNALEQYTFYRH